MTIPASIASEIQKLSDIRIVKLYQIDATNIGDTVYHFTNTFDGNIPVETVEVVGTEATFTTVNNHALVTGERIIVRDIPEMNGTYTVTVTGVKTYTIDLPTDLDGFFAENCLVFRKEQLVKFGGVSYVPIAFSATGFSKDGTSAPAQPNISVSNINKMMFEAVIKTKGLAGATFKRIRTLRQHLDDGANPDDTATMPQDIYRINRMTKHNKYEIAFELASPYDQENVYLPRGQLIKDSCSHRYRVWDAETETFDYSDVTCPYAGTTYFKELDIPTTAAQDSCGKRLNSCVLRFGPSAVLPFAGFPGIENKGV